ncbi:MAG: carbon starvation protein A [Planctomycetes bacterium]|nr:carbon starvation protein A [Planctomycetota bacterium]
MKSIGSIILWSLISLLGAGALAGMALNRGEHINAAWLLVAALCCYAVGYRFYSRFVSQRIFALDDRRSTPAIRLNDGHDYVPTGKWVLFGHHFAAIAGAGPLVGPILAAQFGVLPGALWIIIGVVLGGAVQDLVILCGSMRRDGKSLGQLAKEEAGPVAGVLALIAVFGIILILIAFLSLVVVYAMAESPWATVTVLATIPIALLMGFWMRIIRPGKVLEASAIGLVLLGVALWLGHVVSVHPTLAETFTFEPTYVAWGIIVYGFIAAVLPVWMLLAPRDYLSAFVKVGTILMLAAGILIVLPTLNMPMVNPLVVGDGAWADGSGPVVSGQLFPFCFITIACGAISGFHALVSSGTTPKMIARESDAPIIGYGGMLTESLVAILALIAACALHPGIYYAMNAGSLGALGGDLVAVAAKVNGWIEPLNMTITPEDLQQAATDVEEKTIVARVGGAATLAVGMAHIFSQVLGGKALMATWYHFAIMFEALFILTTVDAGTRVGRFLLQDLLGHVYKPFGRLNWWPAVIGASAIVVLGWGYFVLASIADTDGGVRALLPLFGIANQLLATIALAVGTVMIIRMGKARWAWMTLLPLVWLATVTLSAGWIKINDPSPKVGFLARAAEITQQIEAASAASAATASSAATAVPAVVLSDVQLGKLKHLRFNQYLNCTLCAIFMSVITLMLVLCAWQSWALLSGRKPLVNTETSPMPDGTVPGGPA